MISMHLFSIGTTQLGFIGVNLRINVIYYFFQLILQTLTTQLQ